MHDKKYRHSCCSKVVDCAFNIPEKKNSSHEWNSAMSCTHWLGRIYYVQWIMVPTAIEKIWGAFFELPAKQHCQFSLFGPFSRWIVWIGRNWQCFLAGSSKTAPRILILLIVMVADHSFELISIWTYVPQFIGHNKIFLVSVCSWQMTRPT